MWLLITVTIALAMPEPSFDRVDETLRQRNYAQISGSGPVYGSQFGPIEAWVFSDGLIQQYTRPLDENRREVKRFTSQGRPLTRILYDGAKAINVNVFGFRDEYLIDVTQWASFSLGSISLVVPSKPSSVQRQTSHWELEDGHLQVAQMAYADPFSPGFREAFEAGCRCEVVEQQLTWVDRRKALRVHFQRPIAERKEYGTLWVLPINQKLVTVQWISSSGTFEDRPHAVGYAMVALITGASAQ